MKLRNKLIATIVSISMVLAVIGVGAWASTESFTATITNTVNLEVDNLKGQIIAAGMSGADNLEPADEPSMQEVLYDGSNVIYNQISSNATSGTNLYWEGTRFLDNSEDGMQGVDNETEAAVFGYLFQYSPTEACTGMSTITAMITETALPEISGGKLMVKYFATTDMLSCTEIGSGEAITPIRDNEMLVVVAVCQYYNLERESISSIASAWDFNVTFTAGRNEITALPGGATIDVDPSDGIVLAYNYTSPGESRWEIIEFGEHPQSLKADDVTITDTPTDKWGYYTGSDGAKYAKLTAKFDEYALNAKTNVSDDGRVMNNGEDYYFKVEPIKWRVLHEENGEALLVAHNILYANQYYNGTNLWGWERPEGMIDSDYIYSTLRSDLLLFSNIYFTEAERQQLIASDLDNGSVKLYDGWNDYEYEYTCEDTSDYVFALSNDELHNTEYGFTESDLDPAKCFTPTDYAKATGVHYLTEEYIEQMLADSDLSESEKQRIRGMVRPCIGSGEAWTRSAAAADMVYEIMMGSTDGVHVNAEYIGVLPAMRIKR